MSSPALTLLDGVRWHGTPVTGERGHGLLVGLVRAVPRPVGVAELVEAVWADAEPEHPEKALQVAPAWRRAVSRRFRRRSVQDGRVPKILEVLLVLLVVVTVGIFGLRYATWKVRSKLPGRSPRPERPRFSPVLFGLLTLVLVIAAVPMVAAVLHPSDGSGSRAPGIAILLVLLASWLVLARSVLRPR